MVCMGTLLAKEDDMGWWGTEHGMIGDDVADVMDGALEQIARVYLRSDRKLPTQGEIADLIEFCSGGTLRTKCGYPKHPFSKENCGEGATPRAAPLGNQGLGWDFPNAYLAEERKRLIEAEKNGMPYTPRSSQVPDGPG